ncbi:pyruvate dehydrogenase complex E1 component subunit beta [Candidatus Nesciobacter abundans]|uniref:Pyruvate dehydrogenase complex E1 component subunit beta n=1 Tax=Candidatus Nesciobacter abundans TaxID=2601668 RepID=A0A5C0UG81_9PROT|nr:pyruvate dehydrogenase complex E1 component subunit beta [Candidatus Nesciobacter abundans]QEK39116.1 pyruvate dehydrogenase complex E1 component subunit beta [Candidatus Nesciobacter abundans]
MNSEKVPVRVALRDAMAECMREDETVFVMGEDVAHYGGSYKVTEGLHKEFGDKRVIDTPISEMGFGGIGVGAALSGLRPVVEFMTFNFAMQAIDHIINSAAKSSYMSGGEAVCPIVFRGPNGMAAGTGAQHSQCFASWYAHCPGLKVISPYDSHSAKELLKASIKDPDPVVFLEQELMYGEGFALTNEKVEIGKAAVIRKGTDVTLVSFSRMVGFALKAAEECEKLGISCEVVDLRTLRPIDEKTIISSVKKTNRVLAIEEGWAYSGIASEVISIVNEKAWDSLDAEPLRVTAENTLLPYAKNLEELAVPTVEKIINKIKYLTNKI